MQTVVALLAVAFAAAAPPGAPAGRLLFPSQTKNVIEMHVGVPGVIYLGQPLSELLARFPAAQSTPFAGQDDVVRIQIPSEGISCLAMGRTPASMTLESIGFTFGQPYEGIEPGVRRTVAGIGAGSSVNDLLGTYGRPAETSVESRGGGSRPARPGAPDPDAPVRHLYRSADSAVTTYFVVHGSEVVRMALGRPSAIERFLLKKIDDPPSGPPEHP